MDEWTDEHEDMQFHKAVKLATYLWRSSLCLVLTYELNLRINKYKNQCYQHEHHYNKHMSRGKCWYDKLLMYDSLLLPIDTTLNTCVYKGWIKSSGNSSIVLK